jgi:hypothetical protein
MALTTIEQVIVELYRNCLTERDDDYCGRVINLASVSEDDLIKRVVDAGTDINPATLKASYERLKYEALKGIVRGEIVSFGTRLRTLRFAYVARLRTGTLSIPLRTWLRTL